MSSSAACLTECGVDMPAEVHSVVQRDAMAAYAGGISGGFFLGET